MNKAEFAKILDVEMEKIPQKDYDLIEYVYTWVPGMDKPLAAQMYKVMGLRAFRSLKPWADEAHDADEAVQAGARAKEEAKAKFHNSQVVEFLFSK